MSARSDSDDDDVLDYDTLFELRGDDADYEGPLDHPCPLCGPNCRREYNRTRPVLRTWKPSPGFITYYCAGCEAKGYAHADTEQLLLQPRPRMVVPRPVKPTSGDLRLRRAAVGDGSREPSRHHRVFQMARYPARSGSAGHAALSPRVPVVGQEAALHPGALRRAAARTYSGVAMINSSTAPTAEASGSR